MLITYVDSRTLGSCPAAVVMDDGTIQVNADVWNQYTPFQKRFIIAHEQGHYELQTASEELADRYALRLLYGSEPKSLKQSIGTLVKMGSAIPSTRMEALYREALTIDANNNNQRAIKELNSLKPKQQIKNIKTMRQSKYNLYHRADGAATTATATTEQQPLYADTQMVNRNNQALPEGYFHIFTNHKPGVQIGNVFLDLQTIIAMASLVVLCMIYKKK